MADSAAGTLTQDVVASQYAAPESGLGDQAETHDNQGAAELIGMRAVKDTNVDFTAVQSDASATMSAALPGLRSPESSP